MTQLQARRAIVFGATGFVGTHVCSALVASGYEILGVARGRPVREFPYTFLELDVTSAAASTIGGLVDTFKPDVVVNTIGSIWGRSDDQMWSAAARPVETLLAGLESADHRPWLVHLGSVLEYGTIGVGETANARHDAARPTSAYGTAKLAATESILDAVVEGNIDAVVLRIANVSGPGAPNISLLGQVARQLADAKVSGVPATITLDALTAQRDYVDVRDVADAVVAATRVRVPGTVLDIGRGDAVGVREMVRKLLDISGVDAELTERETVTTAGRPRWTQVDIGPAREHLGWVPTRSIDRSIEDFWLDTVANMKLPHTHGHPTRT